MSGVTRHDFGQIRKVTHDLAHNEQVTRKRLEMLEDRASTLEQWAQAFSNMTLRQRVRWLIRGK